MRSEYDELLRGLYDPRWAAEADREDLPGAAWESDRRVLDLSARIWKLYPATMFYAAAQTGDEFIVSVARRFPDAVRNTTSVTSATRHAVRSAVLATKSDELVEICAFDGARHGRASPPGTAMASFPELERTTGIPAGAWLATFSFDVIGFALYLEFLVSMHAPAYVVRRCGPMPRRSQIAVYRREDRMVASDVTEYCDAAGIQFPPAEALLR